MNANDLSRKIDEYSVSPTPGEHSADPTIVIVVPYGGDLSAGFARALRILPTPVRLVGMGVTLQGTWPSWVKDQPGLVLTELGAYWVGEEVEPTESLRASFRRYCDSLLDGVFDDVGGADALYPALTMRVHRDTFDMRTVALGIAARHQNANVEIVGGAWADVRQRVLGSKVPSVRERLQSVAWPAALAAANVAAYGGALIRQTQSFLGSRETRKRVRELRSRRNGTGNDTRDTWVALIPDMVRANKHVVESVGMPALAAGRLRGVLLIGSLKDGLRTETKLATQRAPSWQGLGPLLSHIDALDVEQLVGPETVGQFVSCHAAATLGVLKVTLRAARNGPSIREGDGIAHDLYPHLAGLARFCTIDVMRAYESAWATRRALGRISVHGHKVVTVGSNAANAAAPCVLLGHAGATTFDFFHGGGIEHVPGPVESPASVHVTWIEQDADMFRAMGKPAVEAGMPLKVQRRTPGPGRRVLILSNYVHRDEPRAVLGPYQDELLRIATLAPAGFELRWRPHPADSPTLVQRTLAKAPGVTLSPNPQLEVDVAWADFIVSSISTSTLESMFSGVPVFVHALPMQRDRHPFSFVARERTFFRAEELWPKLLASYDAIAAGTDPTAPERDARASVFHGGVATPTPFDFSWTATSPIMGAKPHE